MPETNPKLEVELAVLGSEMRGVAATQHDIKSSMERGFDTLGKQLERKADHADLEALRKDVEGKVSKDEYAITKKIIWGAMALIGTGVGAAVLKLIGL